MFETFYRYETDMKSDMKSVIICNTVIVVERSMDEVNNMNYF